MNEVAVANNQGRVWCMSLTEQRVFDKEHLHRPGNKYNGACLASFRGHTNIVTTVCFVDNDKYVYSAARDGSIRVWDLEQLEQPVALPTRRRQQRAEQSDKDFEPNNSVPPSISEAYATVHLTDTVTCICPFPAGIILM
jgi:WD40 repeat protein